MGAGSRADDAGASGHWRDASSSAQRLFLCIMRRPQFHCFLLVDISLGSVIMHGSSGIVERDLMSRWTAPRPRRLHDCDASQDAAPPSQSRQGRLSDPVCGGVGLKIARWASERARGASSRRSRGSIFRPPQGAPHFALFESQLHESSGGGRARSMRFNSGRVVLHVSDCKRPDLALKAWT